MIKYTVEVKQIHSETYEIESETPLSREELIKKVDLGEEGSSFEYDRTLDPEHWTIRNSENGDFIT